MKIDGYVPVDTEVALEQGVTFEYEMPFGVITIRSKTLNQAENKPFALAFANHQKWSERKSTLGNSRESAEAERKFLGILYDHGVISWETTIQSEGEVIQPTRENFIELMRSAACRRVPMVYLQDASDDENFRPVSLEEDAKNSRKPSAGRSGGAVEEKSS
jgi:hypothetical protein